VSTQIIILIAVAAFLLIVFCCVSLVAINRLRRVMEAQFETLDNLLGSLRAGREHDKPGEPPR
jgi:Flp pilus assembly protein TadB